MTALHLVLGTGPMGLATARALVAGGDAVDPVDRPGPAANRPEGVTVPDPKAHLAGIGA